MSLSVSVGPWHSPAAFCVGPHHFLAVCVGPGLQLRSACLRAPSSDPHVTIWSTVGPRAHCPVRMPPIRSARHACPTNLLADTWYADARPDDHQFPAPISATHPVPPPAPTRVPLVRPACAPIDSADPSSFAGTPAQIRVPPIQPAAFPFSRREPQTLLGDNRL